MTVAAYTRAPLLKRRKGWPILEKHNIHYGTQRIAERRFRLFLGVALILLSVIWAEMDKNVCVDPNALETEGVRETFSEAAKDLFRALTVAPTEDVDAESSRTSPVFDE